MYFQQSIIYHDVSNIALYQDKLDNGLCSKRRDIFYSLQSTIYITLCVYSFIKTNLITEYNLLRRFEHSPLSSLSPACLANKVTVAIKDWVQAAGNLHYQWESPTSYAYGQVWQHRGNMKPIMIKTLCKMI